MYINYELNGLIHKKYPSVAACARSIGWNRDKLTRFVHGNKNIIVSDCVQLADCLEVSVDELAHIILQSM